MLIKKINLVALGNSTYRYMEHRLLKNNKS